MPPNLEANFQRDIKAINDIPIVAEMLDIICRTTGMGFAAVARVTDKRWIACAVADKVNFNLQPGGELKLETTICHEIRQHGQPVAFNNVNEDEHFVNHHTPKLYGLQSYISVPIILKNGIFFGTLCAIDPKPNVVNTRETLGMFKFYADLLSFHLHAVEHLEKTEFDLQEERKTAELREQFIAILGHDLRNPVGAVRNVAQLLQSGNLNEAGIKRFAGVLMNSSQRMTALIENVMDFARGRLGSGITLVKHDENLQDILNHIIDELQLSWPERVIQADLDLPKPINSDGKRIAQLFSNLLSNALSHGDPESPVFVVAQNIAGEFILKVSNAGKPIPEHVIGSLFAPFARGNNGQDKEGLGLGLFISSEIARAHDGDIDVRSDEYETAFTFRMALE